MATGLAAYSRNIGDGSIDPWALSSKARKYSYCTYPSQGAFVPAAGHGSPAGATGSLNYGVIPIEVGGVLPVAYHIKGAGQTIVAPTYSLSGLNWALDQADDEGVEIIFGGNTVLGKHAFTIGTNPKGAAGFFMRLTVTIGDVSGTDQFQIGFRKVQAEQTAMASYTDYATIGILTSANPALIQTSCRLNSGSVSTVSTTQTVADATALAVALFVSSTGVVTWSLQGGTPTVLGANFGFQFDTGDVVVPVAFQLNSADLMDTVNHSFFECGYQKSRAA